MTIIRTKAQEAVMRIFQETIKQVRGDVLVKASVWMEGKWLFVAGARYNLSKFERILVLGAGKASAAMASAIDEVLRDYETSGLVVTKHGHSMDAGRIEVIEAGHPIPDEASAAAGKRMLELAGTAGDRDLVIVLVSGGASALMEVPVDGIVLRDLQLVTESMLASGADIMQLNAVRSCLSKIKAGGLARACGKATVLCLLLSDVIGNAREVVGSGPCWGAPPSGTEAMEILRRRKVPVQESVAGALRRVPSAEFVRPDHFVIGDIFTLLEAAQKSAERLGFKPKVYSKPFTGEARVVGARMAAEAIAISDLQSKHDCVLAAGETTVTVRGAGQGGRNQELACAAALALETVPNVALLAIGTDGSDGPTDAAGGLVDGDSYSMTNLRRALEENDSYVALEGAAGLVITGPTQTNLDDLVIIARVVED